MLKISKRVSVTVSIVITGMIFAIMIAVAATVFDYPALWFASPEIEPALSFVLFTYAELLFAFPAAGCLLALLLRIGRHQVFVTENIACLRSLSWLCFAEGLLFFGEGVVLFTDLDRVMWNEDLFTVVFFLIAFACVFMGTILRVVKNTFEEAASIKDENDYTI